MNRHCQFRITRSRYLMLQLPDDQNVKFLCQEKLGREEWGKFRDQSFKVS